MESSGRRSRSVQTCSVEEDCAGAEGAWAASRGVLRRLAARGYGVGDGVCGRTEWKTSEGVQLGYWESVEERPDEQ